MAPAPLGPPTPHSLLLSWGPTLVIRTGSQRMLVTSPLEQTPRVGGIPDAMASAPGFKFGLLLPHPLLLIRAVPPAELLILRLPQQTLTNLWVSPPKQ